MGNEKKDTLIDFLYKDTQKELSQKFYLDDSSIF